jgi:Sec7-like guanine-nucleotide exchange factor
MSFYWCRLPGEAQKIDRMMEKFAEQYLKQVSIF